MPPVERLFADWITREPTASLLLAVVAVLLFGVEFSRSRDEDGRAWAWGRRLIESLVKALVFVGLLGVFYFLLNSSYIAFSRVAASFTTGGSLSNQTWQQWQKLYGGGFTQQDLLVTQFVETETQEVIQPSDPSKPPLYRNVKAEEAISQNSILGFRGRVTINLADPVHQPDTFNAYTLSTAYEYDIVNPIDTETRVAFNFPLSSATKLYQDISVKMDGQEVAGWRADNGGIVWDSRMSPGQKSTLSIHYVTWGMDNVFFEVLTPREVTNFKYTVALDVDNCCLVTEPQNGGIQLDEKTETRYKFITWTIDRAILAPRMGVYVRQGWPYAPYQEMIVTLPYASRALLLFLAMMTLTLLICGAPVSLRQVALLACLFTLPFLVLMVGGIPALKSLPPAQFAGYQVKMLPVLALLPLVFAFVTLRKLPRLPLALALVLMAFFLAGYPFVGLLPEEKNRNVFEEMAQVGMIVYIFGLTLFIRVRKAFQPQA